MSALRQGGVRCDCVVYQGQWRVVFSARRIECIGQRGGLMKGNNGIVYRWDGALSPPSPNNGLSAPSHPENVHHPI